MQKSFFATCLVAFICFALLLYNRHMLISRRFECCGQSPYIPAPAASVDDERLSLSQYKILNGHLITNATYLPWLSTVFYAYEDGVALATCTATVITHMHLLTAAHCLADFYHTSGAGNYSGPWDPVETDRFCASVGRVNYNDTSTGEMHQSKKVFPHPNYTFPPDWWRLSPSYADMAIIELERPLLTFSPTIRPVCLCNPDNYGTRKEVIIAGWGAVTDKTGNKTSWLHDGHATIREANLCSRHDRHFRPTRAYCVQGRNNICFGDSGGPLLVFGTDRQQLRHRWCQIGVAVGTPGGPFCQPPDAFTKIDCAWVANVTTNLANCEDY